MWGEDGEPAFPGRFDRPVAPSWDGNFGRCCWVSIPACLPSPAVFGWIFFSSLGASSPGGLLGGQLPPLGISAGGTHQLPPSGDGRGGGEAAGMGSRTERPRPVTAVGLRGS